MFKMYMNDKQRALELLQQGGTLYYVEQLRSYVWKCNTEDRFCIRGKCILWDGFCKNISLLMPILLLLPGLEYCERNIERWSDR